MNWPLGKRESLTLEFKRGDALKDPSGVAREVVGFLNGKGGEIWIGVGEIDGVASEVEGIPDARLEGDRLQDVLVDRVEPSPVMGAEVQIEAVPFPEDPSRWLLRVVVEPGRRGPYALLRQMSRAYLVRTGSRLRTMTREEVAEGFRGPATEEDAASRVGREVQGRLRRCADEEGVAGLRVFIRAVGGVELRLEKERLEPLFRDPRRTGNRPLGWNFTSSQYGEVRPFRQADRHGYRLGEEGSVQWTTVSAGGDVDFGAGLERLQWQGQARSLWPLALLEFPVSLARLVRTLYAEFAARPPVPDVQIVLGLGLFRIGNWTLRPGSPNSIAFRMQEPRAYGGTDAFLGEPVLVSWKELHATPDRCAFHLVRQVYQAFGFEERDLPVEYDRDSGRVTFPA